MRKIVMTGASGGLAQAVIALLPDDFVILLGRDAKKLAELYAYHPNKAIYEVDICNSQAIEDVVAEIYQKHQTIDVCINNAGYAVYKNFEDFSDEEVLDMFRVNTFATMEFCRQVGRRMKERQAGHLINIVSMSGLIASAKSSVYSASKFALIGFSNTIRLELAPYHVSVTTVNPGPVATKFFDQADPEGTYLDSVKAFVLQPDAVAKQIVSAIETQKREVNLPRTLSAAHKFYTLFPRVSDFLARTLFNYK